MKTKEELYKKFRNYFTSSKEGRRNLFEKEYFYILQMDYNLTIEGVVVNNCNVYRVVSEVFGIVDLYPKSDRLHIHKGNEWKYNGLKFILDNLIKM